MERGSLVLVLAATVVLACCTGALAQVNLLVNPSFQDGGTGYGSLNGWSGTGTGTGLTQWHTSQLGPGQREGHTGNAAIITTKVGGTAGQAVWGAKLQQVNVTPGAPYECSAWYKTPRISTAWDGPGGADQWAAIGLGIYDSGGNNLALLFSPKIETITLAWTKLTWNYTMRADASYVRFYLWGSIVDVWDTAYVKWDDAFFGVVPEPCSLSILLMGIAGTAIAARRRR